MLMVLWAAVALMVIYLDQVTKWLSIALLKGEASFELIPDVLRFTYVENRGAAFGMLDEHRWVFLVLSTATLIVLIGLMWKLRKNSPVMCLALSLLVGGGIGNMIDRLALGYVVDFVDFCAFPNLWKWVFNLADSAVCVGAVLLLLCVLSGMIKEYWHERAEAMERSGKFRRNKD